VLEAAGLCLAAVCRLVGMYTASFNHPGIPARLEALDNRKQNRSLTQTYPSQNQFVNWGTGLCVLGGEVRCCQSQGSGGLMP